MAFNATTVTADAFVITPSTNAKTVFTAFGFVAGTNGKVNVVTSRGSSVVIPVQAGVPIPLAISSVRTTNTTVTVIAGFGPQ